jgi:hypothetical protein
MNALLWGGEPSTSLLQKHYFGGRRRFGRSDRGSGSAAILSLQLIRSICLTFQRFLRHC